MSSVDLYMFEVEVLRVVDGDTVDVEIDLGFDVRIRERTRLDGVDTPELNSSDPVEREAAKRAKVRVQELMPVGSRRIMESTEFRRGKYGRVIARFILPEGDDLGVTLLREGHARRVSY